MRRRVVVTGLGVVCSAGADAESFLASVAAGRCCLSPVSDPRYRPQIRVMAGLIPALPASIPRLPDTWPALDRFVHLALSAADQAIRHSGVSPASLGIRMGATLGTCSGPTTLIEAHYQSVLDGAPDRSGAQTFRTAYGSAVRALARVFGIRGFTGTVTTACSAGLTAIGTGADLIRSGMCDVVLAGGADAYSVSTQIGFDGLKAPSDGPSAPFSKPTGLCLGEGSAFLVLEDLDTATGRGAPVLAEVLGFGTSNDAHHCSAPDPSGQGQSMAVLRAMADARIAREDVAYVNAHGTGTAANDKAETKAIRRVFGPDAAGIPVSSQKAVFGHTLGAAGVIETTAALLCGGAGVLPPTANFTTNREGCDLDYVPEAGRPWPRGRPWVKESFAFGGHNAVLVLGPAPSRAAATGTEGTPPRRVCISGIGLVTSGGAGIDAFLAMLAGQGPAVTGCTPPGHPPARAALAPEEFGPELDRRFGLRRMDKAAAMGTVAAHMALTHAGLSPRPDVAANIGLYLGHSSGSNSAEASFIPALLANRYQIQSVADFPFVVPNATAGTVCRALGMRGQNAAFCFGGGAGLLSLVAGVSAVMERDVPFLLVGAVDVLTQRGWGDSIPDAGRIPAEGAAMFLIETEEHLRARGGRALAVVAGMAAGTDAAADWDGAPSDSVARSVADAAMAQSGLSAEALKPAGGAGGPASDVVARVGYAEACAPLFDIAAAVLGGGGNQGGFRPFLSCFSSRQGVAVSVVVCPAFYTGTDESV